VTPPPGAVLYHRTVVDFPVHVNFPATDRYGRKRVRLDRIPPMGAFAYVGLIPWEEGLRRPLPCDRQLAARERSSASRSLDVLSYTRRVVVCPRCGKQNPDGFTFCGHCTAPLAARPPPALEERKIVSVLFCDLVGFTAASERADPEDVRARLRPYHARLRQELERHGSTVEKFVGDAVMSVFGAPLAHEDDAERAVRCGLQILEAIAELNETDPGLSLQVRIGINTGEAVVALGAKPEQGEGIVTGDVVNTASRLEGAAPVNGIAVSEQTYRQTQELFDYEQLPPVSVKGKAEPLLIWRARSPRSRFGTGITRRHTTPLVGRELEKRLLIDTFERAAQQRSLQLVTIVGEPGVGKSRLVTELFAHIDAKSGPTRWRQGRCLPYGEGIAFWALGEIIKAEFGILESDSPAQAAAKLGHALPADDPDRAWLEARLAPLVGAGGEPAAQEESFTAWQRFCESLASERPAVLVFEDLHWADVALLSFLEHLADWSQGVPLLLLCTARPELYERHRTWAAGLRDATTINLAPLSDDETARLISALLDRTVLPAETQRALLERAGGNPLYAEEFVRLLADRELLAGAREEVPLPDSVQALIAARLDTLSPERKSLLQDAAVLGKVFWAGAVAEMGGREPREVELALHELARKELVRAARTSSMEAEHEYTFWHLLVREVCYAQIPRAARAARHRAAAAWIERKGAERPEDLADVLAHHYLTALELARAAGQQEETDELAGSARRFLALAGERALAVDVERAEVSLASALALAPAPHPERARLVELWAGAAQQQGRLHEARAALEEALALARDRGEPIAAGRALTALANVLGQLGDPRRVEAIAESLSLLEAQPPGPELVAAWAQLASTHFVSSAYPETIEAAEQALRLAAELGLPEPARALGHAGAARSYLGDQRGLDDMGRALALALEQGKGRDAAVIHNNRAVVLWRYEGPQSALAAYREGLEFSERRGIAEFALGIASGRLTLLAELGRIDEALVEAEPLADRLEAAGHRFASDARSVQLRLIVERGEEAQAAGAGERLASSARESGEPQLIALGLAAAAELLFVQGKPEESKELLAELARSYEIRADPYYVSLLPELVRCALALQAPRLAAQLVDQVEPLTPLAAHAVSAARARLAEGAGENAEAAALYAQAAKNWRQFGNVPERAYALLGQGRCLRALGQPGAEEPLREGRDLFASMGYGPAQAEAEALLEQTPAKPAS
jgi:class 3 adenylate cyclase/tetratricopeptide (TPR) repeat protein